MSVNTSVKTSLSTLELIGSTEEVNTNDWSEEVTLPLAPPDVSGEILGITLISRLSSATGSTGTIQVPDGKLFFFDADPGLSVGDTELASGIHDNILGFVDIIPADWYSDAKGAAAYNIGPIPFFNLKNVFLAWFHEDAADFNDATGDEEILEAVIRYRTEDK